jgi:exopolyphosphatase/guanosine-5'-triphosphate,3'-diphosphate pyrophosphatase
VPLAPASGRRARPRRGAVVDLGSNALRLQIVEAADGGEPVVLARIREPVRLGGDVFAAGRIGDAAVAAAERALAGFRELCAQYGVQRVRVVATAALREAANREAVIARLSSVAPAPIEVISGTEEAWLLLRAVEARVDLRSGRSLLVDLGGGSAELVVVEEGRAVASDSQPLGALRLIETARRAAGADHGPAFLALVEQLVGRSDHRVADRLGPAPVERMVAVGGSAEALADLEAEAGGRRLAAGVESLATDTLARWIDTLAPLSRADRERRFGLLPDRADVIVPAAVVYRRLAGLAGARDLLVPRVSLRDGLLRDVLAAPGDAAIRAEWRETLLAAARALAGRYRCDLAHAERVRVHAASLFDRTAALHGRSPRDRALLEAAAVLHDAGRFVSSERHEEHTAWLVRASELVGLSLAERELVALAARYHAGPHPAEEDPEWTRLSAEVRARACVLAALLRLADGLDRQHRGAVESLELWIGPGAVELALRRAPGEAGRPMLELDAAREKGAFFEAVFGVTLRVSG